MARGFDVICAGDAFLNVAGLNKGSPVRMGGVDIGNVTGVSYSTEAGDAHIYVQLAIVKREAPRIRKKTVARIVAKGLLGDKMLELSVPSEPSDALPPGSTLRTEEPTDAAAAGMQDGAAADVDVAPAAEGPIAEAEFVKGKRRKKAADKPVLVVKPGEVVVSRRLYRSGQSEYLINGRVARLRDIQEMFMGVGLGPDSYAIIEQGRIGLILSTKPMERRAIIEEAAGVTKFKTKKRLAEAKLESSKVNLSRVNDIVVEVEKQLGSLKRQAAKARRY